MRTLKNGTADGCIETNQLRKMTLDRKINRNETAIKKNKQRTCLRTQKRRNLHQTKEKKIGLLMGSYGQIK